MSERRMSCLAHLDRAAAKNQYDDADDDGLRDKEKVKNYILPRSHRACFILLKIKPKCYSFNIIAALLLLHVFIYGQE